MLSFFGASDMYAGMDTVWKLCTCEKSKLTVYWFLHLPNLTMSTLEKKQTKRKEKKKLLQCRTLHKLYKSNIYTSVRCTTIISIAIWWTPTSQSLSVTLQPLSSTFNLPRPLILPNKLMAEDKPFKLLLPSFNFRVLFDILALKFLSPSALFLTLATTNWVVRIRQKGQDGADKCDVTGLGSLWQQRESMQ